MSILPPDIAQDHLRRQAGLSPYACRDGQTVRRIPEEPSGLHPSFVRDAERILGCRIFNRYGDKTQVFSLYRNDDITRRMQHVQMVSRIGRNIGRLLNLNQDLIEAIALGHDIGHTPFGHAGERFLSELYRERTDRSFRHHVQSVRFLDRILDLNLSVQTLDGILCHNGRAVRGTVEPEWYAPDAQEALAAFGAKRRRAVEDAGRSDLVPGTLEGLAVRLADVLAYLEKDRQDARLLGIDVSLPFESNELLGSGGEFVDRVVANLAAGSYGRPYLHLDEAFADAIQHEKKTNYERIYARQDMEEPYPALRRMFRRVYEKCVTDLEKDDRRSPVWRHHASMIGSTEKAEAYLSEDGADQITVDYIASMTDDYFIDFHEHLFPGTVELEYRSYFAGATN